jgi:hypothetical protein
MMKPKYLIIGARTTIAYVTSYMTSKCYPMFHQAFNQMTEKAAVFLQPGATTSYR